MPMRLTHALIPRWRLHWQSLLSTTFTDPVDVVRAQGAVQSQDYACAKWGLAMRLPAVTERELDALFDRGAILRTHVMRPTWHFVTPQDIRWIVALTGPRIQAANRAVAREIGFDARTVARAMTALQRAMEGGRFLDREEIRAVLARARVRVDETRPFAYMMMHAETEALVCSGPRRGKQITYGLLEERVAPAPTLSRDEAVRELVRRYFTTHAPATVHDFTVWSGLTVTDARAGLAAHGDAFTSQALDGQAWWYPAGAEPPTNKEARAWLLPAFDEYFIGYKDRAPLLRRGNEHAVNPTLRELLTNQLCVGGQLIGSWSRTVRRNTVEVSLAPRIALTRAEQRAVEGEVRRYGSYLGLESRAEWAR